MQGLRTFCINKTYEERQQAQYMLFNHRELYLRTETANNE